MEIFNGSNKNKRVSFAKKTVMQGTNIIHQLEGVDGELVLATFTNADTSTAITHHFKTRIPMCAIPIITSQASEYNTSIKADKDTAWTKDKIYLTSSRRNISQWMLVL